MLWKLSEFVQKRNELGCKMRSKLAVNLSVKMLNEMSVDHFIPLSHDPFLIDMYFHLSPPLHKHIIKSSLDKIHGKFYWYLEYFPIVLRMLVGVSRLLYNKLQKHPLNVRLLLPGGFTNEKIWAFRLSYIFNRSDQTQAFDHISFPEQLYSGHYRRVFL